MSRACIASVSRLLVLAAICLPGVVAWSADEEGFTPMFNGKDFEGWTQRGGKATYRFENGEVVGVTALKTPNSFMCTDKTYGDFILELEFKVDPKMNSGVQIRSLSDPAYKNGQVHGYQVEIDPSARSWTGGVYDEGRRGWLNDLKNNKPAQEAFKQNEWNTFRIECRGSSIKTWLNGVPAADLTDDMTKEGFIALQVHQTKEPEPMEIRWRNIRIKTLP